MGCTFGSWRNSHERSRLVGGPHQGCTRGRATETDAAIAVGDVRIAQPMDGPNFGEQRPVLVLDVDSPPMFAQIALMTPELDLAGGRDVLLDGSADNLPYKLLVELDVLGPVFVDQLGGLIGRVEPGFADTLGRAPASELAAVPTRLVGLPITHRSDPRWDFKTRELATLHALIREALRELLSGVPIVVHHELWKVLLSDGDRGTAEQHERLAETVFACDPLAPVSPRLAAQLSSRCGELSSRMSRDAARVVTRHLLRSLRSPGPGAGSTMLDALMAQGLSEALAAELAEIGTSDRHAATILMPRGAEQIPEHFRVNGPRGNLQLATQIVEVA